MMDISDKWLYRVGGISGIVIALGYVVIIGLYAISGGRPEGAQAWLAHFADASVVQAWWGIIGLSVITDILFLPLVAAIYQALKELHKGAAWMGALLVSLFVFLDLALTWPHFVSLISLSKDYSLATGSAQSMIIVLANYVINGVLSPLASFYIILVPGLGILLMSIAMLRGVFGKATAYAGIATGIFSVISFVGPAFTDALGLAIIFASLLTLVWCFLAGVRLYRLSR